MFDISHKEEGEKLKMGVNIVARLGNHQITTKLTTMRVNNRSN